MRLRSSDNVTRAQSFADVVCGLRAGGAGGVAPLDRDGEHARVGDVSAAILVGGRARRFNGELKAALRVGEHTILERQLAAIRRAGIGEIWLVGRWPAAAVAGVRHAPDLVDGAGPLGALYAALLLSVAPIVVILAGDLPFVEAPLIERLGTMPPAAEAIVPRTGDRWHPLCAGYRRRVALRVKARLDRGALRVSDALADMSVQELTAAEMAAYDEDGLLLMNVNTPDDHQRAQRRARVRA